MRTTPFFTVYKRVLSRLAIDPEGDVPSFTGRAVVRGMNRRTRISWRAWDWPDFSITEERAYRRVWNSTSQYFRVSPNNNNNPDEVFYIPTITYYQVVPTAPADPPIGTLPTNTTYFQLLAPLDPYVSFDQICARSIGRVIGIYKSNPRLDGFKHSGITFKITENGIDLFRVSGPTIFVKYLPAPSKFSIKPWVSGKSYNQGDVVFDGSSDSYVSIVSGNTQPWSNTANWRLMPLPEILAPYVEAGAYADCLRENHSTDKDMAATAMRDAVAAEQEAIELLQSEIDVLMGMGQRHSYQQHRQPRRWTRDGLITTPTWQAGTVTTLTGVCQADGMYPPPPIPPPLSESGVTAIPLGASSVSVTFQSAKIDINWRLIEIEVDNSIDPTPLSIDWSTIYARTVNGFSVLLSQPTNTANYTLRWTVQYNIPTSLSAQQPSGQVPLIVGQDYLDITFLATQPANWDLSESLVENSIDNPPPQKIDFMEITKRTPTGFRAIFNASPPNGNYTYRWTLQPQFAPITVANVGTDFRINPITGGAQLQVRNPTTGVWTTVVTYTNP